MPRLCVGCQELPAECVCPPDEDETGEEQDAYRGVIVIEWPAPHGASPYSSMNGARIAVTDAVSGKQIRTCVNVEIHANAEALVTAELTLFADEDGEPILDGDPVLRGEEILTGVFPFFVAEMRVRER